MKNCFLNFNHYDFLIIAIRINYTGKVTTLQVTAHVHTPTGTAMQLQSGKQRRKGTK